MNTSFRKNGNFVKSWRAGGWDPCFFGSWRGNGRGRIKMKIRSRIRKMSTRKRKSKRMTDGPVQRHPNLSLAPDLNSSSYSSSSS
jgi:hypothetical protein